MKTLIRNPSMIEEQQKVLTPDAAPVRVGEAPEKESPSSPTISTKVLSDGSGERKLVDFAKKHARRRRFLRPRASGQVYPRVISANATPIPAEQVAASAPQDLSTRRLMD